MRVGIDVSQALYEHTGVANYLVQMLTQLIHIDRSNEYILFFSSLRGKIPPSLLQLAKQHENVQIKAYKMPQRVLHIVWNQLHIVPIEWFTGKLDVFISSDWTQPPSTAPHKLTILYDLIVYTYPEETDARIISVQKKRLAWVVKECSRVICISESTKNDAQSILGIPKEKLHVVYPGVSL